MSTFIMSILGTKCSEPKLFRSCGNTARPKYDGTWTKRNSYEFLIWGAIIFWSGCTFPEFAHFDRFSTHELGWPWNFLVTHNWIGLADPRTKVILSNPGLRWFQGISESTMTYEITLFFRQFWIDPRLAWGIVDNGTEFKRADDTYNVAADMVDLLWVPDSFFIDEIGTYWFYPYWQILENSYKKFIQKYNLFLDSRRHTIMSKNVFLEIHEDGHILLSERLSLKLKCPMHLRYYPFDLQICPIRIESYAFRDSQVSPQN